MRRPFVAGNWKMHTRRAEAVELARAVARETSGAAAEVAVCVPFPHLAPVSEALAGTHVLLGAQNLHWEPQGAFTGEVSAPMLADYCQLVIIGHSERRQYFGETDDWVRRKVEAALRYGLRPIVCVGETLAERRAGSTLAVLERQVRGAFAGLAVDARITIAYEPVWAIGTGETATPEQAQEACAFIRSLLRSLAGSEAERVRIQYGGSVNAKNARELLLQPDIDGALVGGASLRADEFATIVRAAEE
ncbi:Triosephosphate isomerase [bacterium HR29]|jgi:triosephosphate isomerase|nr:Triosephosphate isomerase [bacterium HR29]